MGDLCLIPGLGRSSGEGKGYPLHYSGLENSMDCIVHGVTKSWTQLSDFHFLSKSDSGFPVTKAKGLAGREPLGGWRALAEGGGTVVRQALGCLKMI